MHKVCDKFNGVEEDKQLNSYEIYDDLINADEYGFTFEFKKCILNNYYKKLELAKEFVTDINKLNLPKSQEKHLNALKEMYVMVQNNILMTQN